MSKALLKLLDSWDTLMESLTSLREDQVAFLLEHEMANSPRRTLVERLHARYTKLRSQRERAELMAVIK